MSHSRSSSASRSSTHTTRGGSYCVARNGFDGRKDVEPEPARQRPAQLTAAGESQRPRAERRAPARVSHPDVGEGAYIAGEVQVDVAAGVAQAHLGAGWRDDQPVAAVLRGCVWEVQFDHGAVGDIVELEVAVDVPDEQARVEVLLAVIGGQPAP